MTDCMCMTTNFQFYLCIPKTEDIVCYFLVHNIRSQVLVFLNYFYLILILFLMCTLQIV